VYGHTSSFRPSAGLIDYTAFLNYEWKRKKIDVRTSPEERYRVLSAATNGRHPSCPEEGMKEADADRLLQELGCYADISLSARIAGSDREIRTYTGTWVAVTREGWDTFRENCEDILARTRNPFDGATAQEKRLPDGRWMGQHRGWKLLECIGNDLYQRVDGELKKLDLGSTGGNRIKICYKDGELGVFIASCTGTKRINTLRAFNSMYCTNQETQETV
jgi:hypothetical protein